MSQRRTNYASEKWCVNLNLLRDEYAEKNGKYNKTQGKYVISNEAFGQYLGIGTTSVFDYCGGYKEPSLSQFVKIANAFNVSLDWLTGQPGAVRSANSTVQEICKYTGLSDKSVENLHLYNCDSVYSSLDLLIQQLSDEEIIDGYTVNFNNKALDYIEKYFDIDKSISNTMITINDEGNAELFEFDKIIDNLKEGEAFRINNWQANYGSFVLNDLAEEFVLKRICEELKSLKERK